MQKRDFDIEILINDDASTDNTADIIREYEKRYPDIIKPIYHQSNMYSKGVTNPSGRYNFPRAAEEIIDKKSHYPTASLLLRTKYMMRTVSTDFAVRLRRQRGGSDFLHM